jgi:hypothetical protein
MLVTFSGRGFTKTNVLSFFMIQWFEALKEWTSHSLHLCNMVQFVAPTVATSHCVQGCRLQVINWFCFLEILIFSAL